MKNQIRLLACFLFTTRIFAAEISLELNKADGVYAAGEPVVCRITVTENGAPLPAGQIALSVLKNGTQPLLEKNIPVQNGRAVFEGGAFNGPVHLQFSAVLSGITNRIGAVVDPEQFAPGCPEPADLDSFWAEQKAILKNYDVRKTEWSPAKVDGTNHIECFDVQIPCAGGRPASGYYARPANVAEKSLPAVLSLHAAGVSGHWTLATPKLAASYASRGGGAICLDLSAHGLPNGRPVEFYKEMEAGPLKDYPFQGLDSREQFYFRFMYLRLLQAIEFLSAQPEWDGRILAIGESQGGGQALAAAALDSRITTVVAIVPALCDFAGSLDGRENGWPNPLQSASNKLSTVSYFDNACLASRSKASTFVEVGLIDKTCPPSSVFAAYNRLSGEKTIVTVPYRGHQVSQLVRRDEWGRGPFKLREQFLDRFFAPHK